MNRLNPEQLSEIKDGYIVMRSLEAERIKSRQPKSRMNSVLMFNDKRIRSTRTGDSGGMWVWCGLTLYYALSSGLYNEQQGRLYSENEIREIFKRENIREYYYNNLSPENAYWKVFRNLADS